MKSVRIYQVALLLNNQLALTVGFGGNYRKADRCHPELQGLIVQLWSSTIFRRCIIKKCSLCTGLIVLWEIRQGSWRREGVTRPNGQHSLWSSSYMLPHEEFISWGLWSCLESLYLIYMSVFHLCTRRIKAHSAQTCSQGLWINSVMLEDTAGRMKGSSSLWFWRCFRCLHWSPHSLHASSWSKQTHTDNQARALCSMASNPHHLCWSLAWAWGQGLGRKNG